MRSQRLCVIVLTIAITVAYPSASFADSTPTPRATSNIQSSSADYKIALSLFKVEVKLREQNRKKINQVFILAVNEAHRKAKTSMKLAKSASAKREILLQQDNAILLANKIRAASILAMGDPLKQPVSPDDEEETQEEETQEEEPTKSDKKDSEPTKKAKPKK